MRCAMVLLSLSAFACGGAAQPAVVAMNLSNAGCIEPECVESLTVDAIVVPADEPAFDDIAQADGELVMHAVFSGRDGRAIIVELAGPDGGRARARYVETENGEAVFEGKITEIDATIGRIAGTDQFRGNFSFIAEQDGQTRVITEGVIAPPGDVLVTDVTAPPSRTVPTTSPTPRRTEPRPQPRRAPVVIVETSGCDAPTSDTGGGGCEGDSSSGGCEGDTASSGGGCDCEGDYAGAQARRDPRRIARGMWNLCWPIAFVGFVNRRQRSKRSRGRRSSR